MKIPLRMNSWRVAGCSGWAESAFGFGISVLTQCPADSTTLLFVLFATLPEQVVRRRWSVISGALVHLSEKILPTVLPLSTVFGVGELRLSSWPWETAVGRWPAAFANRRFS